MDEQQEKIERYLAGKMLAEELQSFEDLLKKEPGLRVALELEETARLAVKAGGRAELRSLMDGFEDEWQSGTSGTRRMSGNRGWKTWLAVAATVLITLIAGWWWPQANSSEALFAEYFTVYPSPETLRSVAEPSAESLAMKAYRAGDFSTAALRFAKDTSGITAQRDLYRGLSLLAATPPNYDAAIEAFNSVLSMDTDYRAAAGWYKALSLLAQGQTADARQWLETYVERYSYKRREALELLNRMKP